MHYNSFRRIDALLHFDSDMYKLMVTALSTMKIRSRRPMSVLISMLHGSSGSIGSCFQTRQSLLSSLTELSQKTARQAEGTTRDKNNDNFLNVTTRDGLATTVGRNEIIHVRRNYCYCVTKQSHCQLNVESAHNLDGEMEFNSPENSS